MAKERIHHGTKKLVTISSGEWLRAGHIQCDEKNKAHVIMGGDGLLVHTNRGSFMPHVLHTAWREMDQVEAEVARLPSVQLN